MPKPILSPEKVLQLAIDKIAKAVDLAVIKLDTQSIEASNKLANAADKASSAIASAQIDANKLLASQAASAAQVVDTKTGNDHDLILEVKTIQNVMLGEIREIKQGTAQQITDLQNNKLDIKDSYPRAYKEGVEKILNDHEDRIRANTGRLIVIATVGSAILIIMNVAMFIVNHWF